MGFYEKIGLGGEVKADIDWDLTPADTFGTFESWGGRERVRNRTERFYYFFVDNWQTPARLCLMERGIKHARIMAQIKAPQELLDRCVARQGKTVLEQSYAIDETIKKWLIANILDNEDDSAVIPLATGADKVSPATGLPGRDEELPAVARIGLRREVILVHDDEIAGIVRGHDFYESQHNPGGDFRNYLVDNQDDITVTDVVTGLTWLRSGHDITSVLKIRNWVAEVNRQQIGGYDDWRLPTIEEALSLLTPEKDVGGLHLHRCFDAAQPFIFLADQRKPGGCWFVDFRRAVVYWASGTNPGAFGRLCRG